MRTRLFAFCILALFIGIPATLYWYFFSLNVTTLELVLSPSDTDISVILEGRIEYEYLPLADKALVFRETCRTNCTLELPPLRYDMTLTVSGYEEITESITLPLGSTTRIEKILPKLFQSQKKQYPILESTIESALIQNANTNLGGTYRGIGNTRGGKYLALRNIGSTYDIGILSADRFISIFSLPYSPKNITLDASRTTLIIDQGDSNQYLSSLDGMGGFVFPITENIYIADTIKGTVLTESGSYTRRGDRWINNPRFTDTLALSNGNLLGYIDKDDTEKLSLQNYPLGESIFVEIDKESGRVNIRKTGLDIVGFTLIDGEPGYIDRDGGFFTLEL